MMSESSTSQHEGTRLKRDRSGLPLIPQPTSSPLDPLNYPDWLKYLILGEICVLGVITGLATTMLSPAVDQLAREFHISPQIATYHSLAQGLIGAIAPVILVPFANVYGHRLVFLVCTAFTAVVSAASAQSTSFGVLIVLRGLTGVSLTNSVLGMGAVPCLFFVHQRGRMMGLYILISFSGTHLAPAIGGYVAFKMGWRWAPRVGAILAGCAVFILIFFLPDTLFQRPNRALTLDDPRSKDLDANVESISGEAYQAPPMSLSTYLRCLRLLDSERMPADRKLRLWDVWRHQFRLLAKPSVTLPAICSGLVLTYASVGPLFIAPAIFTKIYRFNSLQNGLSTGLSVQAGVLIGEIFSGSVTDYMIKRARIRALKDGRQVEPEIRLQGIWPAAVIVPLGLLMFGFTIRYTNTFIAPCAAIGFACIGVQIASTVCFTYTCGDCFPAQSNDVSQCMSFVRVLLLVAVTFYEIPLGERIGFQWAFAVFAGICTLSFLSIVVLVKKGAEWRRK